MVHVLTYCEEPFAHFSFVRADQRAEIPARLAEADEADRVELGNYVVVQLPGERGQRHPLRCLDDVACSHD